MSFERIQVKRGTAAAWVSNNPVLAAGEIGLETDTLQFKFGDGTNNYGALPYFGGGGGGVTDGDKGDVIVSGGGTIWLLDAAASRTRLGISSGTATIDITGFPGGYFDHVETVAAVGLVTGDKVHLQLAFEDNAEENGPEMLDVVSLSGECFADNTLTVLATFSTPTRGPINLIYGVI